MTKRERIAAYREAARKVADGDSNDGCCKAIYDVTNSGRETADFMFSLLRPDVFMYHWWPLDDRDSRVIALCLAAEMVRTGDL